MSYQQQIDAAFTMIRAVEKRLEELEQLGPLLHAVIAELKETRKQVADTRALLMESTGKALDG